MECTVWAASSDSEDATTTEIDEEVGASSSTCQPSSLFEGAAESSTNDAQGSIDFVLVNKAAPRKRCDFLDVVKVEAGEKPPRKPNQNLIHFGKKDENQVPVPSGMHSTLTVNISEDGISNSESEDLTMQTTSEDEEQELVTEEDLGETAEELEFHSSTSKFGVSRKQNPTKSELQKKRRNFTEDGQGQASKLAKTSEHRQKNQMPCASTESGESVTDLTRWQWSEGFQARHLEEKYADEEPIHCTQSTVSFSPSSQLLESQEEHTGAVTYKCPECNNKMKSSFMLTQHRIRKHNLETPYKCSECNKHFATAYTKRQHLRNNHDVQKLTKCSDCNENFSNPCLLSIHQLISHTVYDTKGFAGDEALDFPWEDRE